MRIKLPIVLLVFCLASTAHAWSYKEHIQFTRMAAARLLANPTTPPAMKAWLAEVPVLDAEGEKQYFLNAKVGQKPVGFPGVLKYAYVPDEHAFGDAASKTIEFFGAGEKPMHFIDLELFLTGDRKREYRDDLSAKPKPEDIPRDKKDPRYIQAGFLPLRVEYCYGKLIECIRENRLGKTDKMLEGEEDSATRWAGYLAHYLEDNTQPQHATIDYKSATYFGSSRKAPNVHSEMEYRMCDDEKQPLPELRAEFWPLFIKALEEVKDPADSDDLFKATLQVSFYSYDALPMIGRAAKKSLKPVEGSKPDEVDTAKFFRESGEFHGKTMTVMQMKALQTALAVKRVERVWKKAWEDAAKK